MKKTKTIYLAGDHAGFKLKEKIKNFLENRNYLVEDLGPFEYNPEDDYPDFVVPLAKKVSKDNNSRGIIIAGSGEGEIIAANRIHGARAVLYYGSKNPKEILELSRAHNNSNILSLGARFLNETQVKKAIDIWLKTPFSNALRHKRRLEKIEKYSKVQ
ncbi:RpiB/LacA/LacB family sugar-phosphate isomerase [Candidatus Woesearchaeota archaeon]|nr:RpiB/LacA/LacB family sugar-phosphate isomerase [Candidatus Woesearchaeota archaeon]